MLLNCGIGEDSWESLGLQGDPTSQSERKLVLNIHWKDWCWSWNSSTLVTWYKELTHLKRPWCRERLKAGEGDDRGWDGWIAPPDGFAFKQAPGGGEGQGAWCVVVHQVSKNQTWTTTTKKTIEVPWRRFGTNLSIPCSANEIASIRRNRWFIRLETSSRFCN